MSLILFLAALTAGDDVWEALEVEGLVVRVPAAIPVVQQDARDDERWRYSQVRRAPTLFDFSRWEVGGMAGMANYSDDFEADPSFCVGVMGRIPTPGLLYPLPGLGIFAQVILTQMERDIAPVVGTDSDDALFVGGGFDATLYETKNISVMGQIGMIYSSFGDISDTAEGYAMLSGVKVGVHLTKGLWLHFNPQFAFSTGTNDSVLFLFAVLQLEY